MSELMSQQGWFMNIVRDICFALDMLIYKLMRFIFQGIFDLASLRANADFINDITSRIYVILGIYMVFKLSITFFSYIVDPDSMTDTKGKGVGKVISNTMTMLALLVLLPMILFGYGTNSDGLMYQAQDALLPMLPRIILGIESNTGIDDPSQKTNIVKENADSMAAAAFSAFFYMAPAAYADGYNANQRCDDSTRTKIQNYDKKFTSLDDIGPYLNDSCPVQGSGRHYIYNYSFIISGVVGLLMVIILIGILLDVGKRVFKLLILQVIAPVPIMSYIDPKSAKEGAFAAWVKSLTSTFLEIFFKIGIVYVVLELIGRMAESGGPIGIVQETAEGTGVLTGDDFLRTGFLYIILIIALLLFAKEAPKFIKDSMGIKDSGKGSGMMGAIAAGAAGMAGTLAHGGNIASALGQGAAMTKTAMDNPGKPVNAFRKSSDATVQAISGDKDRKTGAIAGLQRMGMKGMGRKEGATQEDVDIAKKNKEYLADKYDEVSSKFANDEKNNAYDISSEALDAYNEKAAKEGRQTYNEADLDSLATEKRRDIAYAGVASAKLAATKSESHHKAVKERAAATGNLRSDTEDYRYDNQGRRTGMYRPKTDTYTKRAVPAQVLSKGQPSQPSGPELTPPQQLDPTQLRGTERRVNGNVERVDGGIQGLYEDKMGNLHYDGSDPNNTYGKDGKALTNGQIVGNETAARMQRDQQGRR